METCERLLAESADQQWSGTARLAGQRAVQDSLAIGIAGMREEPVRFAVRSLEDIAPARGGVRPWIAERPYDPASAAFVLGTACHCLDWDDFMHPMHGHCSAVLLPTVWAVVESRGGGGKELLDAFLAGYQVDYLTSLVLSHGHYHRGWHATSTIGTIGAAAAAATAMGLSLEQRSAAMGIAASLAGGLRANFGTPTKSFHAGIAARHGVQAAQLARAGATSSDRWLTGPNGMLQVMGGDTDPARAAEVVSAAVAAGQHGIDTPWGHVQKPFACCGSCHGAVDALIQVVAQNDIRGEDIASIDLHVDPVVPSIMREVVPTDPYSARYSLSWVMASAAIDRASGPDQFSVAALDRTDIRSLRTRVRVHPDLQTTHSDRFAGRVVVTTHQGLSVEGTVTHSTGHPANPMSDHQRRTKQAVALTSVMSAADADAFIATTADLDALPSLAAVSTDIRTRAARRAS